MTLSVFTSPVQAKSLGAKPSASLQSYTGIWNMPNARILPDWRSRLKFGRSAPYYYYGGALGVFDWVEIHGQFNEVDTITAFPGFGYGNYKDRAAGARLVLLKETEAFPQVAVGAFDVTGTALFGSRYLVASKMFGNVDITLGLGQGILAGEFVGGTGGAVIGSLDDTGLNFLFSSPFRKTRPFAGLEWHVTPDLTFSLEYSSINNEKMVGFVDQLGKRRIKDDDSKFPVNFGIKYHLNNNFYTQAGLAGGNTVFFGLGLDFDLAPGELLGWKKRPEYKATERIRHEVSTADPDVAVQRIADELYGDGFSKVSVAIKPDAVWVETATPGYLSDARALARVGEVLNEILPSRIRTFYISIVHRNQVLTSWKVGRSDFMDYRESRLDPESLLEFSSLDLYLDSHWKEFESADNNTTKASSKDPWYDFSVAPKIRTFLNNRAGFFKHKIVLRGELNVEPWDGALFTGTVELPVFNEYDDLVYPTLEEEATRTDIVLYEERKDPHLTQISYDQIIRLPYSVYARAAVGMFEAAYGGFGAEMFRYFNDGLWGAGLEVESVRKRDLDNDFTFSDTDKSWRTPAYLNLYAQVWPEQGIEGGLKIGKFLAGDEGVRIELRRTFKYFTLGAWYTKTDTSVFTAPQNKDAEEKGVYITFPLAVFTDRESKRRASYAITSFTRDQGQTVAQPRSLYPVNPFGTPVFIKQQLNDMRN